MGRQEGSPASIPPPRIDRPFFELCVGGVFGPTLSASEKGRGEVRPLMRRVFLGFLVEKKSAEARTELFFFLECETVARKSKNAPAVHAHAYVMHAKITATTSNLAFPKFPDTYKRSCSSTCC